MFEAKWCLKWDIFRLLNFTVLDFYFISTALGGTEENGSRVYLGMLFLKN